MRVHSRRSASRRKWPAAILVSVLVGLAACSTGDERADAYGNFEATDVLISAETAGRLLSFDIEEGSVVAENQVVGLVDTVQLALERSQLAASRRAIRSKLASTAAQIAVLEEQRRVAQTELDRIHRLLREQAATTKQRDDLEGQIAVIDRQIDQAQTQRASIHADIDALDAQVALINDQIRRAVIVNPVNGTVLTKFTERHELVSHGRALYKVADLTTMELRAYVSGAQLAHVRIGEVVDVQIDEDRRDNRTFQGVVSWIADEAEFTPKLIQTKEERVNLVYAIKVRVDNPNGVLKVGMPGEVRLRNQSPDGP